MRKYSSFFKISGGDILMTPSEFKEARKALGHTQSKMAKAIMLSSSRTIRKYEAGEREIPGPVIFAVTALLDGYKPAGKIAQKGKSE